MSQETINQEQEIEIIDDYSPLNAPVKERAYTKHKVNDAQILGDLEEPTFMPPSFNEEEEEEEQEREPLNQAYSELSGKEKTTGAKLMVDVVIDLYSKLCGFAGKIPQISEDKIDRLVAEGEIDPSIQIPTEAGNLSIKEFAQEYNESIKDAFEVSDEFKETVSPIMERVFKKRGIGMTDEQSLAYYFGTDLLTKGVQVVSLRKTTNNLIDSLKENSMALRESYSRTNPQAQTSQTVKQEPVRQKEVEQDIEEEVYYEKPNRGKPENNLDEQVQYFEPEEVENEVYSVLKSGSGFKHETKVDSNMPNFGDPEILAGIDKIEKESVVKKPVRKNRTAKKTSFTKRSTTKRSKNTETQQEVTDRPRRGRKPKAKEQPED